VFVSSAVPGGVGSTITDIATGKSVTLKDGDVVMVARP
jgi:hypothetical protein